MSNKPMPLSSFNESRPLHLVRDVLDKQIVDAQHDPMGRVDGIELRLDLDGQPHVRQILVGHVVMARRIGRRTARAVRWFSRHFGLFGGRPVRIGWEKVESVGIEVEVTMEADISPTCAWEKWWYEHVIRHLPGGKSS